MLLAIPTTLLAAETHLEVHGHVSTCEFASE